MLDGPVWLYYLLVLANTHGFMCLSTDSPLPK